MSWRKLGNLLFSFLREKNQIKKNSLMVMEFFFIWYHWWLCLRPLRRKMIQQITCSPTLWKDLCKFMAAIWTKVGSGCFLPTVWTKVRYVRIAAVCLFLLRWVVLRILLRCLLLIRLILLLLRLILLHVFHLFIRYIHPHHHSRHVRSISGTGHFTRCHAICHFDLLVFRHITNHMVRGAFRNSFLNFFRIVEAIDMKARNFHAVIHHFHVKIILNPSGNFICVGLKVKYIFSFTCNPFH